MKPYLIIIIYSIILTLKAFAGNEFSGGHVIQNNSKYELFEFFEFGISNQVSIPPSKADLGNFKNKLNDKNTLKDLGDEVTNLVVDKLNQIFIISPEFSVQIYNLITRYQWRLLNIKAELIEPEDIGPSPIDYSKLPIKAAALRTPNNKLIYVLKSITDDMEKNHLAGLIFHEALSDYVQTTNASHSGSETLTLNTGNSAIARVLTTYLFSEKFNTANINELRQFMLKMGLKFYYTDARQYPTDQLPRSIYKFSWEDDIPTTAYQFDVSNPRADYSIRNAIPLDLRRYTSYEEINESVCLNKKTELNQLINSLKVSLDLIQKKFNEELQKLRTKYKDKTNLVFRISGLPIDPNDTNLKRDIFCKDRYCSTYEQITIITAGSSKFGISDINYETISINWPNLINFQDLKNKSELYRKFIRVNLSHADNKNTYKCFSWDEYRNATKVELLSEVK